MCIYIPIQSLWNLSPEASPIWARLPTYQTLAIWPLACFNAFIRLRYNVEVLSFDERFHSDKVLVLSPSGEESNKSTYLQVV